MIDYTLVYLLLSLTVRLLRSSYEIIGLSGKFMPIFGRWRKEGLNISERLKTNDMRTYRKRWYFKYTWKNIWKKILGI